MTVFQLTPHILLLGGLIGYLVGSIPFAYLITRRKTGKDLRREGTGNIGTANAYDVTGSKRIGMMVLSADLLKGMLPVLAFILLGWSGALLVLLPALILGHCYPVWLRFHGGRGLATAAGAVTLVSPPMLLTWLLLYALAKRIKDDVHFASIIATSFSLALIVVVPLSMIRQSTLAITGLDPATAELERSIALILLIILSRHIEPFIALVRNRGKDEGEIPNS